jgi:hypothetical protein
MSSEFAMAVSRLCHRITFESDGHAYVFPLDQVLYANSYQPCGEQLYDDFIETRHGAARALEAYLNRPRTHTPSSPIGRSSTESTLSSVFSTLSTSSTLQTPASTYSSNSWGRDSKNSPTRLASNNPFSVRIGGYPEEQWLLTCANEGKFTPKIVHLDVNAARIKSDKDLALALREHYEQLNRKWFRIFKLRGLSTIEFVQVTSP